MAKCQPPGRARRQINGMRWASIPLISLPHVHLREERNEAGGRWAALVAGLSSAQCSPMCQLPVPVQSSTVVNSPVMVLNVPTITLLGADPWLTRVDRVLITALNGSVKNTV
jgi:hypothetical protein